MGLGLYLDKFKDLIIICNDKMRIPVYILPTQTPSTSTHLYRLFEKNKLFRVVGYPCKGSTIGISDIVTEANQVIDTLENAYCNYPDSYCILIKDTSVTNSTPQEIGDIVLTAIGLNRNGSKKDNWDLCYLTKWLDRCDLYETLAKIDGVPKIVKTFSPLGLQAVLYSPHGRDIVLGRQEMGNGEYFTPITPPLGEQLANEIAIKNISASAVVPNLFDYNVMAAQIDVDLLKLAECRLPDDTEELVEIPVGPIPFYWFLVVVGGIILLAWFFYQFIGKYDVPGTQEIRPIKKGGG